MTDTTFNEKVVAVQSKMVVPKTNNEKVAYKSRSAEEIQEIAKPILAEVGLAISVDQQLITGPRIFIKSIATLTDGENTISGSGLAELLVPPQNDQGRYSMNLAQACGATGSYSDKIALENVLGIGAGEDADHNNYAPSQPSQAPNPATQIRQEHFSGAIKATAIDEQTLTKLNFLPNDLGLPKDQAKAIWGQLWQQGIRRGKFDPNTKKWANTEISTSDIKTIVEMFGGAAGKTSDSIQAITMQLGGDLQVDTPTNVDDYSDAPFDDNEPF